MTRAAQAVGQTRQVFSLDDLFEHCETLPGVAAREYPFGDQPAVYKIGGKIFVFISEDAEPLRISVKHDPEEGEALRAEFPGQVLPGYHLNRRHWSTIVLDPAAEGLDADEVLDLVKRSHELVRLSLPRRLRPPSPD